MECARCGRQNQPGRASCDRCGEPLSLRCEACNQTNSPSNRFCGQCGAPLPGRLAPPDQAAQRVLRTLSSKGGERKRLTILFADIRDSTQLIDSLGDPELAMQRLDPVLNLMKEAVHRYDGVVNKTQGDGVMALFGAPVPHEDHAVRGCLGALAMQDSIARLADPHLQVRVGLHTGEVIVQVVENSMYQTYDAAGANVHLANRLEHMAEAGTILISKETYTGARQFVEAEPLGTHALRGIASPVSIYKLIGRLSAPASDVFRSGQRLLPLIGRNAQLAVLERELDDVLAARGAVVGIVGEAGIGKSRLCFEFAEHCRRQGIRVYEARVLAHGRATPFQPVLELLRDFFGIRPKEPVEVSRQRVVDRLEAIAMPDTALVLLLDFMNLADPARPALRLDPGVFKTRLLNVFKTLFRAAPADGAMVIMIEDLHWVDEASEEFVEALAEATVGTKTLLVVNYRPGFAASFMQQAPFHELHIVPLASEEASELLRGVFGDDPSLEVLARDIVERAQGNPFFLEELASAVSESGGFEGERGAYRLKGGIGPIPLPPTVHAVVAARIDRLGESAKNVLEAAAVIGRSVALAVLKPVTGIDDAELFDALAQLRQADLLYDLPPFDMGVLAFRHPLIQEVAYAMQLRSRLSTVHAAVAKAIEALDWGTQDEFAALIASHYEFAGQTMQAVEHLQRAARWIGRTNTAEALRLWKKIRSLLQALPQSERVDRLRALASGQILNFGWREGISAEEVKPFAEEALRFARSSDKAHEPLLIGAYGRVLASTGAADDYVDLAQNAIKLTSGEGDVGRYATVNAMLAQAYTHSGRMNEALSAANTAIAAMASQAGFDSHVTLGLNPNQILGFDVSYWVRCIRARAMAHLGQIEDARSELLELVQQPSSEVAPVLQFVPHFNLVELAWMVEDQSLAREHARRVSDLAETSGIPYIRVLTLLCASLEQALTGRFADATNEMVGAIEAARAARTGLELEARMAAINADLLYRSYDFDAAIEASKQAILVAKRKTDRVAECYATTVLGLALAGAGRNEQAAGLLEQIGHLMNVSGAFCLRSLVQKLQLHLEAMQ
ncbi:adenylate/guanylate cyclase domain-containing protein [Bradyrhizobium sp. SZCCHNRI1009]|uniref:adenylate/guanylate cyclase domain-containing protein n=1 Tax=unclassified Bradyrhizobium TaxID=2631580 RepID=UPI002915C519|nr:adenylate/guanylate cyclase domain-containing protein [Bradyrhizobium sp. SZCCHNRI1009]